MANKTKQLLKTKHFLNFEVAGRRGRERRNMTWKRQMEEHINQIGLKRKDARVKWRNRVYELSRSTR